MISILATLVVALAGDGAAPDPEIYRVSRATADCLLANREAYTRQLTADRSLIFVYPTLCPTTSPTPEQRAGLTTNSRVDVADGQSRSIPLTRSDAACFFSRLQGIRRSHPTAPAYEIRIDTCPAQ